MCLFATKPTGAPAAKLVVFLTLALAASCQQDASPAPRIKDAGASAQPANKAPKSEQELSLQIEKACPAMVPTVLASRYEDISKEQQDCVWAACEGETGICNKLRLRLRQSLIAHAALLRGASGYGCLDVDVNGLKKADKAALDDAVKRTYACMKDHCMSSLDDSACRRGADVARVRGQNEDAKVLAARAEKLRKEVQAMNPAQRRQRELDRMTANIDKAKASCAAGIKQSCPIVGKLETALERLDAQNQKPKK